MTDSIFSLAIASDLYNSKDRFPVDFDMAWDWLGYSTKSNAKRTLIAMGFEEGEDLIINDELGTLAVPAPQQGIWLTVDCFKSWGMMAGTPQGKTIRKYFLECERIAKRNENDRLATLERQAFGHLAVLDELRSTQRSLIASLNHSLNNEGSHEKLNALAAGMEAVRKAMQDIPAPKQDPGEEFRAAFSTKDFRALALEVISAAPERGLTHRDIYRSVYGLKAKSTAELVAELEKDGLIRIFKRKADKGREREFIYPA